MDPESAPSRRDALADRMLDYLLAPGGEDASFRALAAAAGVSRPTLVHHFGDHAGALKAAVARAGVRGAFFERIARTWPGAPEEALTQLLTWFALGWRGESLGRLHRLGLIAGLQHTPVGAAYIGEVLEPSLAIFEDRLARWTIEGALVVPDPRAAALQLVAPVYVALLHQHELGGAGCRPLDVPAFIGAHVGWFVAAYAPKPAQA